jgi:5-methylcytosine-specific restriction endonuclease McrA
MNGRVLVLNLDFNPISICTVQRAFLLVYLNKAELVKEKENQVIHTVTREYVMPSVIKLKKYINIPYRSVLLSRENIFKRDSYTCQYCGSPKDLTMDHVIPKSRGGKTTWDNLITACKRCNAKKGDVTPRDAGLSLNYKPFRPSYIMFLREFSGYNYEEWKPYLGTKTKEIYSYKAV